MNNDRTSLKAIQRPLVIANELLSNLMFVHVKRIHGRFCAYDILTISYAKWENNPMVLPPTE